MVTSSRAIAAQRKVPFKHSGRLRVNISMGGFPSSEYRDKTELQLLENFIFNFDLEILILLVHGFLIVYISLRFKIFCLYIRFGFIMVVQS